jgi:hypothetical protein
MVGMALVAVGCSGSSAADGEAAGSGGSASDAEPTLLEVLLRHNAVRVRGLEAECALCGCGGIVGGEPETQVCVDRVIREEHPELVEPMRQQFTCLVPIAERETACLESAMDCAEAEACRSAADPDEAVCEPGEVSEGALAALSADLQTQCGDG